jgi:DNA gyrase subunit A
LREDDRLIRVTLTDGKSQMLVASYNGKVVRFPEDTVRPMGRTATGVRAIKLDEDGKDRVVGMICVEDGSQDTVLVISEKGYGKRTLLDDENGEPIYRITNRGGKGVKTMNVTEKTGNLIGMEAVNDDQDLMLITKSGTAIRMAMNAISVLGRATQGVKLIELQKRNDTLMFGCTVPKEETEEVAENAEAITDNVSTVEE